MRFYNILVFRGIPTLYTYSTTLTENLLGFIVDIPIAQSVCKGLVVEEVELSVTKNIKFILNVDEAYTPLPHSMLPLVLWFSSYYQTTPFKAFQTFGLLHKKRKLKPRPILEATASPFVLTTEQENCIESILKYDRSHQEFYIHGITGSGKTEVYMRLVAQFLNENKSSIILVPEIALTPQYVRAFTQRFGSKIFVLHSGLTKAQREKEWAAILETPSAIVIGARSAIFCPIQNLGIIIMDEEHEPSYKQDTHPRYDCHTVAEQRARHESCFLVFGSATPRVETYQRFQQQKKPIFNLFKRISGHALPSVTVVDMKEAFRNQEGGLLSHALEHAISERLNKKEKTIILINRRGFASYIACQKCGTVCTCPHCELSFTYHQDKSFRCHRCGTLKASSYLCNKCGSNSLAFTGTGIQKIELELIRLFPQATVLRLDKDTADTSKKMEKILDDFKQDGDILIGTQLIAKGHHIETVTLVGVLGIDQTLNMPDFRAPERTFQLLTQVAGRAGRGEKPGHVIIQTVQPEHYAIQHASGHDFFSFYNQELTYREALSYPPFKRLIHIILSSKSKPFLETYAKKLQRYFHDSLTSLGEECYWLGPVPSPIEFIRNHHRFSIIIKHSEQVSDAIRTTLLKIPKDNAVRTIVDFDPYSLL